MENSRKNPGDIYEQAAVKMEAGFFRGNSTRRFGVTNCVNGLDE
jgi:hypothetical protein